MIDGAVNGQTILNNTDRTAATASASLKTSIFPETVLLGATDLLVV